MPTTSSATIDQPAIRLAPVTETIAQVIGWDPPKPGAPNGNRVGSHMLAEVLAELARLGIPTPAGVARVLEVKENVHRPPALGEWLAGQGVDELDPAAIAKATQDHIAAIGVADGPVAHEVAEHLLQRAVEQLAQDLDGIVEQLRRKHWAAPAKAAAEAVAAGLRVGMTAEQAIESDDLVTAWRRLTPVIPTLDRIARVYYRALLLCGYPLAVGEAPPQGRDAWLDAATAGPPELVTPSARVAVWSGEKATTRKDRRSAVARQWSSAAAFLTAPGPRR